MTKEQKATIALGIPAALLAGAVIAFWLFASAFTPRTTFETDQRRQDVATDSLRSLQSELQQLKRISCAPLTPFDQYRLGCPK